MTSEMMTVLKGRVAELVQTYSDNYSQFQRATYNLNWYGHVRRGISPLRQLNQGTHSGIVS